MAGKGDRTRELILDKALKLFRRKGFDRTSMRDIAAAADLSLGAAYYYFGSKEALVHAYYERMQDEHDEASAEVLQSVEGLGARLKVLYATKISLIAEDRKFLGALFRFAADAGDPLSVFSPETAAVRERSISAYSRALSGHVADPVLARQLAEGLWLAHLGLLLHALHDDSEGLARTRAYADLIADLAERLVALAQLPFASMIVGELATRLATIAAIPKSQTPEKSAKSARPTAPRRSLT